MLAAFLPIFFVTFGVFVLFFLLMGIGYLVKKQPLKGSCGGVANLMGDEYCQFCGNDPNKCDSLNDHNPKAQQALAKKAQSLGKEI